MENPEVQRIDQCLKQSCADNARIFVSKCFAQDPRYITIVAPWATSAMVFLKDSITLNCCPDACADQTCNPYPVKYNAPPVAVAKIVLKGYFLFAEGYCDACSTEEGCIELVPGNTVIDGVEYNNFDALCSAIKSIIADCTCTCS